MCGIAGFIGKQIITEKVCRNTLNLMVNRGPDYQDYKLLNNGDLQVALLHSRLSIIDLDARSNQPFKKEHCTLVFNGEIYNYLELKKDLQKKHVRLETSSDTEVLLNYYLLYGEKCVEYFEGMWSFAIWDEKKAKLFLSRDRFAEKPLYYLETDKGFYFGSEVKFIQSLYGQLDINYDHLLRYLVNGHKSLYKSDEGYFKHVKQVPFACNLSIGENLKTNLSRYWVPSFDMNNRLTEKEAIEGIRERLINSMKLRLRSDVPLAFCLSGGVDSASLASIAAKEFNYNVASFSIIDQDERYNELENIQATIDDIGCENHKIKLSPEDDFLARLNELVEYHDAPVATISYLVHSVLSQKISEHGYKVAFSGTGADELFTGYYDHHNLFLYEIRSSDMFQARLEEWERYVKPFVRNPHLQNPQLYFSQPEFREHVYLNNTIFASYLKNDFKENFKEENYHPSLLRNRMLNELFHEVVRVILNEDDLNSMKYSVENRSPFLDTDLVSFAYSVPNEFLIRNGYAKYMLREALNGILNDTVRLSREKKGFNASIHSVIDFSNKRDREYLLEHSTIYDLVDRDKIAGLMGEEELSNSFKKFLFNFINAKIFLENN